MKHQLMILCIGLALLGCKDQGIAPLPESAIPYYSPQSAVPQTVVVGFVDGITFQQANAFLDSLSLSWFLRPSPDASPVEGIVSVPLGLEDYWVEQFKTYPIVTYSGRLYYELVAKQ